MRTTGDDTLLRPRWWRRNAADGPAAACFLCAHRCRIDPGKTGLCGVRGVSAAGGFLSPYLGRFSAVAVDPVEKKPFARWRPGTKILSLGSVGCNMRCPFCQNHALTHPAREPVFRDISPETLLRTVRDAGLGAVAYTYHEPTMQAEYILAAAPLLAGEGVATALVTNGMFSGEACAELAASVQALNIDIKAFDAATYRAIGGSLEAVTTNVAHLVRAGAHVELTHLVVPGISDSFEDFAAMTDWIAGISHDIPLHISRCFPAHRHTAPPTDRSLLERLAAHAHARLRFVYLGNV
jgi:Pyruvate-formate lyase-activating enzyme